MVLWRNNEANKNEIKDCLKEIIISHFDEHTVRAPYL